MNSLIDLPEFFMFQEACQEVCRVLGGLCVRSSAGHSQLCSQIYPQGFTPHLPQPTPEGKAAHWFVSAVTLAVFSVLCSLLSLWFKARLANFAASTGDISQTSDPGPAVIPFISVSQSVQAGAISAGRTWWA